MNDPLETTDCPTVQLFNRVRIMMKLPTHNEFKPFAYNCVKSARHYD